jgi:hypothetical protein
MLGNEKCYLMEDGSKIFFDEYGYFKDEARKQKQPIKKTTKKRTYKRKKK